MEDVLKDIREAHKKYGKKIKELDNQIKKMIKGLMSSLGFKKGDYTVTVKDHEVSFVLYGFDSDNPLPFSTLDLLNRLMQGEKLNACEIYAESGYICLEWKFN